VVAGESFTVRLTHQSLQELGLTVGDPVYITFKSTSVKPL
jgi:molybdopterin-binding protein